MVHCVDQLVGEGDVRQVVQRMQTERATVAVLLAAADVSRLVARDQPTNWPSVKHHTLLTPYSSTIEYSAGFVGDNSSALTIPVLCGKNLYRATVGLYVSVIFMGPGRVSK